MLVGMDATEVRAMLARAPGLTAEHVRALLAVTGSESGLIRESRALGQVGMPRAARAFLTSPDQAALRSDLQWIEASGAQRGLCTDPSYPPLLAQTTGARPGFFFLGSIQALH